MFDSLFFSFCAFALPSTTIKDLYFTVRENYHLQGVNQRRAHGVHERARLRVAELEDALDDGDLRGRRVVAAERGPVVGDESSADQCAAAVDRAGDERHLEERRELVLLGGRRHRVDYPAAVRERAERADERVARDGLSEDLDAEDVADDFFCFSVELRVHQRHVVVARDDVAERGETLFDALDDDLVGEAVAEHLQLLVGGGARDEQALSVAGGEASDAAHSSDGRVHDWNVLGELLFEDCAMEEVKDRNEREGEEGQRSRKRRREKFAQMNME